MLWFLIIQVFSSKNDKIVIEEDENTFIHNDVFDVKEQNEVTETIKVKKKFIHDDPNELTEEQKCYYISSVYPVVKKFCHSQVKVITHRIVTFLGISLPSTRVLLDEDSDENAKLDICKLSSDSKWLVWNTFAYCGTSQLTLWNVATGQRQWTVRAHGFPVSDAVFTSDNQLIISASLDHDLKIWLLLSGNLLHRLERHTDRVTSCALSADNQLLVSSSEDSTVRMWSVETGQCMRVFNGHTSYVRWARFYGKERRIVSVGKEIKVWNIETSTCQYSVDRGTTSCSWPCTFSEDNRYLLSAVGNYNDCIVKVWETKMMTCVQTFTGHTRCMVSGCFVHEDTMVASMQMNNTLYIWRIRDAYCLHQFKQEYLMDMSLQHSYWLRSKNTECIIVTTKNTYEVHVVAVESGKIMRTVANHNDVVRSVCVSSDGRYLITGSWDGKIRISVFSENI